MESAAIKKSKLFLKSEKKTVLLAVCNIVGDCLKGRSSVDWTFIYILVLIKRGGTHANFFLVCLYVCIVPSCSGHVLTPLDPIFAPFYPRTPGFRHMAAYNSAMHCQWGKADLWLDHFKYISSHPRITPLKYPVHWF